LAVPFYANVFGEDQGRYLVAVNGNDQHYMTGIMNEKKIPFFNVGRASGAHFEIPGEDPIPLTVLRRTYEGWLPHFMG
jgi:phosphoribosylformylglycinamidine synthase